MPSGPVDHVDLGVPGLLRPAFQQLGVLPCAPTSFFSSAHSRTRAGPSHAVLPYVSATSTASGCLVENLSHAAIILTPRFLAAGKPSTAFAGFLVPPRCGGSLGFGFMRSYEP